jgi:hypothetical protein
VGYGNAQASQLDPSQRCFADGGRAKNLANAPLVSLAYSQAAISTPQVDALLHASEDGP